MFLGATFLIFAMVFALPGDPIRALAGERSQSEAVREAPALVERYSALNEPLVNVLRVAILIFSAAWIWLIASGQSRYPRWLAIFSPAALLALIFALYIGAPSIGQWALPTAMNTAHAIVFALSFLVLRRSEQPD